MELPANALNPRAGWFLPKLTHYGDIFMHDDGCAGPQTALFGLTGDARYEASWEWLPDPPASQSAGGVGGDSTAATAAPSGFRVGRQRRERETYRTVCRNEVLLGGLDQVNRANDAYGLSFPVEVEALTPRVGSSEVFPPST